MTGAGLPTSALEAEIAKLKAGLSNAKLPRYQPAYNDSMREPVCLDSDVVVLEAENESLLSRVKELEQWYREHNCVDIIKNVIYKSRSQKKQP